MKTFWSFAKSYRVVIFISLFFMLIELVSEIVQPFLMSKIIDEGIMEGNYDLVIRWGSMLVGSSLIIFLVGVVGSFYSGYVSQHIGSDMREKVFNTIQGFTYSVFSRFSEASLMTRMTNDIVQVQNMVFMGTRIALKAPLLVIGNIVMAFMINPLLALCLCFSLPIVFAFLAYVMKKNLKLFKHVQAKLDQVNNSIQQSLIGIRLIRVFVRSNYESQKFEKDSNELKDTTISTLRLAELTTPIVMLLINLSILLVIFVGHRAIHITGVATVGEVAGVMNYAMRITGALSMLSLIIMHFSRVAASMGRINEVLHTTNESEDVISEKQLMVEGNLSFRQVSFQYDGTESLAISNISFDIKQGEMVAIMGATGSGKTSILQLIPRLYKQQDGDIFINSKTIDSYSLPTLRQSIGYVPQDILLFTGTIAENIRWGKPEATMEDVIEAAKCAQIHDTIIGFPDGYETIVGQKGVNLSGGQKQRLSIARALVRKPTILLLDDCTSALDVQTENALLSQIRALSCTVLLVTQKMSSTLIADRILIVDDGMIIADGSHEQLLKKSSLYGRIYESQDYTRRSTQWVNC